MSLEENGEVSNCMRREKGCAVVLRVDLVWDGIGGRNMTREKRQKRVRWFSEDGKIETGLVFWEENEEDTVMGGCNRVRGSRWLATSGHD